MKRSLRILLPAVAILCVSPRCLVLAQKLADSAEGNGEARAERTSMALPFNSPDERKPFEKGIEIMRAKLEEFHRGERDEAEGYAILSRMLQSHYMLGTSDSPDFRNLLEEHRGLERRHPEFATTRPVEIRGRNPVAAALTPEQRRKLESGLEQMRPLLEEYHQGKRDDAWGYAVLKKMLHRCAALGTVYAPGCRRISEEFNGLQEKHPEFRTHAKDKIRERNQRKAVVP